MNAKCKAATLLVPMLGAPLGKLQWEKFPPCITRGVVWGMQHVILDGVAILLCQLGIGKRAIIRTFQIAVPWGFFTAVMTGSSCYYGFTGTDLGRFGHTSSPKLVQILLHLHTR